MNIWGLVLSYILVFLIIGISTVLQKAKVLGDEGARKFIHIGVSNWWILAWVFFQGDNAIWFAIVPPITFILLNYYSYKTNLIKSMERSGNGNLGTVYFPISLLILVIFTFGIVNRPEIGAVGILVLGYGDGLAAVIGKAYGKRKLVNNKSLEGSLTMLLASFIVVLLVLLVAGVSLVATLIAAIVVSILSTIIELYTPKGLDNLSVPLFSSLIVYILLLLI
jgi:phytol kinase